LQRSQAEKRQTKCPIYFSPLPKQGEAAARALKEQAQSTGNFPYPDVKCVLCVYSPTDKGLSAIRHGNISLGSGEQTSLTSYMEKSVSRSKEKAATLENFKEAAKERGATKKIFTPEAQGAESIVARKMPDERIFRTADGWKEEISKAKERAADRGADAKEATNDSHERQ
jgi:hypothetical protein